MVIAHVPENAAVWIQDKLTLSKGTLREFTSPPLEPNIGYVYIVRASWVVDGKIISQTKDIRVKAGTLHHVFLPEATAQGPAPK
jgi:uncharacterized protein (TIGR03000 family)